MTALVLKILGFVAIFASVVFIGQFVLNAVLSSHERRKQVARKLDNLRARDAKEAALSLLRGDRNARNQRTRSLYSRLYWSISRAGLGMATDTVIYIMAGVTVVLTLAASAYAATSTAGLSPGAVLLILTFSASVGFGLPMVFFNRRATNKRKKLEEQFPLALEIFTRALQAGHPMTSALELLTEEMDDPLRGEFALIADEVAYGSDLGESLASMAWRWDLPDVKMFAVSIAVQSETGGNLAEILSNLSKVIRDRSSLFLMVRALSAEGRISAMMLAVLPIITFVFLFLVNPEFYLEVADDPMFIQGYTGLIIFYFIGIFWIRRMVDLKV
ncbi:MAG: type II secretion system F family protein [Novosphingobium sp.]